MCEPSSPTLCDEKRATYTSRYVRACTRNICPSAQQQQFSLLPFLPAIETKKSLNKRFSQLKLSTFYEVLSPVCAVQEQ